MTGVLTAADARTIYESIDARTRGHGGTDDFERDRTVIRRMRVDLAALLGEIRTKRASITGADPKRHRIAIFTDVLTVTGAAAPLDPQGHLVIFARRIEASGNARVLVAGTASVTIYAQEWMGEIGFVAQARLAEGASTLSVHALDERSFGFTLRVQNGAWLRKPLLNFGLLREGPDLGPHLESSFIYATELYDRDASAALPLLRWIQRATATWRDHADLNLQCATLLCTVPQRSAGARFVPWLSKGVYDREATAYVDAVRQFESDYERFYDANESLEARAAAARQMLATYREAEKTANKLTESIETTLGDARASVALYERKIRDQEYEIDRACLEFKQGIERYLDAKRWEAGMAIAGAVVSFGKAAAGAAFGMPNSEAMTALNTAVQTAKTTKEAVEALKKLAEIVEKLKAMYEAIDRIVEAAKALRDGSDLSTIPDDTAVPESQEPLDDAAWDIFRDRSQAMVKRALDENIDGAAEYLLSLTSLAVYGKALNQARASYVSVGRELSRQLLQQALAASQVERMSAYIDELEAGKAPNEEMMRWVLQRYNAVRRWVFIALQNHADAYRYWALRESKVSFNAGQKAGELCAALARVIRDEVEGLESFKPAPQDFRKSRVEITDPAALAAFVANRKLVVSVGLDEPAFEDMDRVRLSAVRAWLPGAVPAKEIVRVTIGTAGTLHDRLGAHVFEFNPAWPLELSFWYRPPKDVRRDGAFASQYRPSFFEPTPFTNWTLTVSDDTLDLTALKKIVLEFEGNSIDRS